MKSGAVRSPPLPEFLSWEWLSRFRTLSILRIGYLGVAGIPLVALSINLANSASEKLVEVIGSPNLGQPLFELPTSLFVIYFGSIVLTIGHMLNELLCPPLVKSYASLEVFRTSIATHIKDHLTIEKAVDNDSKNKLKNRLSDLSKDDIDKVLDAVNDTATLRTNNRQSDFDSFIGTYEDRWKAAASELKWVRVTIMVCYVLAALISISLVLRHLIFVFQAAFP